MQQTESPDPIGRFCRACLRQTVVSLSSPAAASATPLLRVPDDFAVQLDVLVDHWALWQVFQVNLQQRNFHLWLAAAAVEFQ
ncbi:hypothetical protein BPNPMPFG_003663 [Mesorhizobium sp. AR07]|uniref:hypothetical protein n=1 Tax=Mesorhizobium sp. AR07 TaxID=2865838 RepID=UPI00215EDBDA|nr:hypothetical protein [Mesorhizobium sp. AR07]UVK42024.1 hypothetical protein BPNPMPFG_003663 [Mesorhizobium sp. AR07]